MSALEALQLGQVEWTSIFSGWYWGIMADRPAECARLSLYQSSVLVTEISILPQKGHLWTSSEYSGFARVIYPMDIL